MSGSTAACPKFHVESCSPNRQASAQQIKPRSHPRYGFRVNRHDGVNQRCTYCHLGSRAEIDAEAVQARNRCKMNREIREVITRGPLLPKVVIDEKRRKPNGAKKQSSLTSKQQLRQRRKHRQTGGGEMLEILAYEIEGQHCSPYASTDEYGE